MTHFEVVNYEELTGNDEITLDVVNYEELTGNDENAHFEVVNYEELTENDENNALKRRRLNYQEIERFPNEEAFQQWIQGTFWTM